MAASVKTLSNINANAYAENFRGGRVTLNYTVPPEEASNEVVTQFDAARHLCYKAPEKRHTLTELGLNGDQPNQKVNRSIPLLDFGYTEPFPLISPEGVKALRAALFTDEVQKNCGFHISNDRSEDGEGDPYNKWEIRGAARYNKFIKEFWESAEVSAAAGDAIGMEVGPTMELELGHTNFQMPHSSMGENAVDGWHYDSNCPFVIIVMLSETEGMEGGETGFATADGAEMRIRYPGPGWAVAMQGMQILHAGCKVRGKNSERLTMVTSYEAKDWSLPNWNDGLLGGVRVDSDPIQLYRGWSKSRLTVLAKRAMALAAKVDKEGQEGAFDFEGTKAKLVELMEFINVTNEQISHM